MRMDNQKAKISRGEAGKTSLVYRNFVRRASNHAKKTQSHKKRGFRFFQYGKITECQSGKNQPPDCGESDGCNILISQTRSAARNRKPCRQPQKVDHPEKHHNLAAFQPHQPIDQRGAAGDQEEKADEIQDQSRDAPPGRRSRNTGPPASRAPLVRKIHCKGTGRPSTQGIPPLCRPGQKRPFSSRFPRFIRIQDHYSMAFLFGQRISRGNFRWVVIY